MSKKLSFTLVVARQDDVQVQTRKLLSSPADAHIYLVGAFERPIDLAHALRRRGFSLSEAHCIVNELTGKGEATVSLAPPEMAAFQHEMVALGLGCTLPVAASPSGR